MKRAEILKAFQEGKISKSEAQKQIQALQSELSPAPLSKGQKGLWVLQKMTPIMSAYNVPLCFRIHGTIDRELFQQACDTLLKQHPILTTVIVEKNGVPLQQIDPAKTVKVQYQDIAQLEAESVLPEIEKTLKEPFLLDKGPLIRIYLFSRSEQEQIVCVNIHHIIFDGISTQFLTTTLFDAYRELLAGNTPKIQPAKASYTDFVKWEETMIQGEEGKEHQAYWKKQLEGPLPTLELPTDRHRTATQSFKGKTETISLSAEWSKQIKSFAHSQEINLSVLFLSVFKLLLYRYTGQKDLIVGMPTLGRPQERFDQLIGYFINMIPIRTRWDDDITFSKLLELSQWSLLDGLDHAAYPFSNIVRDLNISGNEGSSPIFQVGFTYQNFYQTGDSNNLTEKYRDLFSIELIDTIHQEGEYEFGLEIFEQDQGFLLHMKYNPDLFDTTTICRMAEHYQTLLNETIKDPDLSPDHYQLLSETEKTTILHTWNATEEQYPKEKCVHQLFTEQAKKTPKAIAAVYEGQSLTYEELDKRSTTLAIHLQTLGVVPDRLVGICVERSLDMVVGLLGILKSGGAYVPLDPEYPVERLEYMIQDSRAPLILTQSALMNKISQLTGKDTQAVILDSDWSKIEKSARRKKLKQLAGPDDLAYVIYTSGSTGNPKGVMIPHQPLTNFLITMGNKPGLTGSDKMLAVTTYCFDITGLEIYLPLIKGAQCHVCSSEKAKDAIKLRKEIESVKPTIMQATPATWTMLFHAGWKNGENTKILCGGEAMPEPLKQRFIETNSEAWNMFGPTETTVWSTIQQVKANEPITIGKPIANTQIYIVDKQFRPTQTGTPGELCIAGDGLARGYLNREELTNEKFIDNPFNHGTKLYRTGDLACWLPDGNIEFLGRIDHQVKIRGFRIELGEIESQLGAYPEIQDCAVIVKDRDGHKQLIAYYTPEDANKYQEGKNAIDPQSLRNHLRANLPEHMIPAIFTNLDELPLTPNGKKDRIALAARKITVTRAKKRTITHSETEDKVLDIWKSVLAVEELDAEDGFFDVGGDSILAVTAVERINTLLECDLNVTTLFKHRNAKDLAKHIVNQKGETTKQATTTEVQNELPQPQEESWNEGKFPEYYKDSLALIGISCQLPGANTHQQFWDNLREGKESVRFFSKQELEELGLPKETIQNPNYIPIQSTIEEKDCFDPEFFNISHRDAEFMDPQSRLLLQHSWSALEDAGYISDQIPETAVFMTAGNHFYQALNDSSKMPFSEQYVAWVLAQGGTIPTMISHKLGFTGPAFSVHSNCSSSLVGLYSAWQSLQSGDAKYALVGGASVSPNTTPGYLYQPGLNFSGDGHCKAFDATADGMIGGEGVAVILLKKATDAIADKDHIYAILRTVSINNDGAQKVGYYAPSVQGQSGVIGKALRETGINPETIDYVEAHGTGTKLGDPIEFTALCEAYQQYTTKKQFCAIGSVKTNIGHLDAAAGLVGCVKVALSLYNREIPPTLNYQKPNPEIDLENSPFHVADRLIQWEERPTPYRAALSSFGLGGTNGHAILEEFKPSGSTATEKQSHNRAFETGTPLILPLSAKNETRLKEYAQKLITFIEERNPNLTDLTYTFQTGRMEMESRVLFLIKETNDLIPRLQAFIDGEKNIKNCWQGENPQSGKRLSRFEQDEDFGELVNKWMQKGKPGQLAELWAEGVHIDWSKLYTGQKPNRLPLPTYPFAKERYWPESVESITTPEASGNTPTSEPFEVMTFEEIWEARDLETGKTGKSDCQKKTLLCFLSNPENQQAITEEFRASDPEINMVFIAQGERFEKESQQNYQINATDRADYEKSLKSIGQDYDCIDDILYLWPLEQNNLIRDYSDIVHLIQSIGTTKLKCRRLLLTGQAHSDQDRCYIESWIGFERSLALTIPGTKGAVICWSEANQNSRNSIKNRFTTLRKELSGEELQSAFYQEGKRFVTAIHPTTLQPGTIQLKQGGTYLITGGCGGIGSQFALHLAKTKAANLILTGRSAPDSKKETLIKKLENLGSTVLYIQADVCDPIGMKKGLELAKERFGKIDGMIHAAGVANDQNLLDKKMETFQQVLDPKISGTLLLDELHGNDPLDFVCYFSSSSAILGDFGFCDYAVGNRFQMAFAQERNQKRKTGERQGKSVVINWPAWRDGGMNFGDNEKTELYLKSSGQRFLETEEGITLFEQLLSQEKTQHLVLVGKPSRIERFLNLNNNESQQVAKIAESSNQRVPTSELSGFSKLKPETSETFTAANLSGSLKESPESDLKEMIGKLIRVNPDKLDPCKNLVDFGFDSINMADFANLLTDYYGIEISPALFFGYSTIEKLTEFFMTEYPEQITRFYQQKFESEKPGTAEKAALQAENQHESKLENSEVSKIQDAPEMSKDHPPLEPIAIIGMSGRFPGADNIDAMWKVLAEGIDTVDEIPKDRFDWRDYHGDPKKEAETSNTGWCGLIQGVDEFDPLFFEITPQEAETMDPRQRLLLQESWKALEDAGYGKKQIKSNNIGMFVGVEQGDYQAFASKESTITSNHNGILAARLAYFLDFKGPNMAINTACSSGLVAAHQACSSLRNGECDTAIAAAAHLLLSPVAYIGLAQAGMLSKDGKCYTFDSRANGTVPGEAVVAIVLKRLCRAEADRDSIYATIRGSGINYDGRTNGITAPNGLAQTELLKSVYHRHNINPESIEYVVTHGTGTKLGDPVEINALRDVFKTGTRQRPWCSITSTKTNFGHTFAASGLVSLISLVQAFRHETIPASLHCEEENSYIQWQNSPFRVNKANKPWPAKSEQERVGAISAFGMSGTNAHFVLQSYTARYATRPAKQQTLFLLVLSAKTKTALNERIMDMVTLLQEQNESTPNLSQIEFTLSEGRHHFNHRCAIVVENEQEAVHTWQQAEKEMNLPNLFFGKISPRFQEEQATRQSMEALLNAPESRETCYKLAALYCQGYHVSWEQLHGAPTPEPAHLPTYPFAKERYWVSVEKPENSPKEAAFPTPKLQEQSDKQSQLQEQNNNPETKQPETMLSTATAHLKKLMGEVTKIPVDRLDSEAFFEELGMDSIIIEKLNQQIEQWVGKLDSTLFYKYNSIQALAAGIVDTWPNAVTAITSGTIEQEQRQKTEPAQIEKNNTGSTTASMDIAIIGIAGRFPEAETLGQFWENLYEGKDCVKEIPADRWSLDDFFEPDSLMAVQRRRSNSKWGGFLKNIDGFDPVFFSISPGEAKFLDPQERLFLEVSWECLEDAGYTRKSLQQPGTGNQIAVFAGASHNNYQLFMSELACKANQKHYIANSQINSIANRVSYLMNFTGPSMTVDTACSSSLHAVHLACESIRSGQSMMAIAGGVNLSLHSSKYISLSQGQFNASDGRCHAFSEGGTGYVPGEAVGAVFLKPLAQAIEAEDMIYGVLKGTAATHNGRTNGYNVPSPVSQSLAIEKALKRSDIHPRTISYIEAHGTGTALGDPIEITGLSDAYRKQTNETGYCAIASVKSNVGHSEAAAGITQLIKVLLQFKHQTLVKNLIHGKTLNPNIDFDQTPFVVQKTTEPWKRPIIDGEEIPRRAGINSFGAGGSNIHIIMEEYIPTEPAQPKIVTTAQNPVIIVLSARNGQRLKEYTQRLLTAIKEEKLNDRDLPNIAYTLQTGREAMKERLAVVASSMEDLKTKLNAFLNGENEPEGLYSGRVQANNEALRQTVSNQEVTNAINNWITNGGDRQLPELWIKGKSFDWNQLYADRKPRRISLPTYPFGRDRYWVTEADYPASSESSPSESIALKTAPSAPAALTPSNSTEEALKATDEERAQDEVVTLLLEPCLLPSNGTRQKREYQHRWVILCELESVSTEKLQSKMEGVNCIRLKPESDLLGQRFEACAAQLFEMIKKIMLTHTGKHVLVQLLVPNQKEGQLFSALSGLLNTARMENPKVIGQVIEVEPEEDEEALSEKLKNNARFPMDRQIRYEREQRMVHSWKPREPQSDKAPHPWKDQGVYLITGGAGGLGLIFASEITQQVKQPVLILTGRSPLNQSREEQLESLQQAGATILYKQVDVIDKAAVEAMVQNIQQELGKLNGVIHAAGVIRDNFLIKKEKESLLQVMAPKVSGLVNLDLATKAMNLDCFILFSSTSSRGNYCQVDYATASAFMDIYAQQRSQWVASNQRSGQTLVVNWPLWEEGGMQVDEATKQMMMEGTGTIALRTETGINALYEALASKKNQVMVLEGYPEKMSEKLQLKQHSTDSPQNSVEELTKVASELLKVRVEDIDPDAELDESGFDPVTLTEFANRLTQTCKLSVTTTLFQDYTTIRTLSEYLIKESPESIKGDAEESTSIDIGLLREKSLQKMKVLFGEVINLSSSEIEADENFETYGINSVLINLINHKFVGIFGELSQTLLFEYQTLNELIDYFISDYQEACIEWTGLVATTVSSSGQNDRMVQSGQPDQEQSQPPATKGRTLGESANTNDSIAIIGVSGRYPMANNPQEYWENLKTGKDCITEIPEERWSSDGFFDPDKERAVAQSKSYAKWGGFVDQFACFDPLFFNISPREAINMDPQERLFIESCWELFEDAGYTRKDLAKRFDSRVGVFAGITKTGFDLYGPDLWKQGEQLMPHTSFSSLANRVSWLFNLQGPSMPIDTMCSSSLTAIHEASEHLKRGSCEMAIAGGVNLYIHPTNYIGLCSQMMLSTDGQCKSFGEGGNGFVPGEGVGTVLLKPLQKAVRDQDHIYAVIRGTSINHGGKTSGFTVPNPNAQAALIREALESADVDARSISYIEAHGTGTELGDPIEISGLTKAFRKDTPDSQFCAIGSAKSNIGHLEAAAGIAGVTKIIMQMRHKMLVPSLHSKSLNPKINFTKTPFTVQQELTEWKRPVIEVDGETKEIPRIAGISSFGAGGSNAHAIIEEYPEEANNEEENTNNPCLIVLSAKNEDRLQAMAQNLHQFIVQSSDSITPEQIAYTLQTGREAMKERLAVIVESSKELEEKLKQFINGDKEVEGLYRGRVNRNKDTLDLLMIDEDMDKTIEAWIDKKKYSKLMNLWVKGLVLDWNKLYGAMKPRRISMPTYPFAKDQYWLPEVKKQQTNSEKIVNTTAMLHPLLHQNCSDFAEQRFSSTFTGEEFFLADHVVQERPILPGVAYLEMARKATELSTGAKKQETIIRLKNIVWRQPITTNEGPVQVHIELIPEKSGQVSWNIYQNMEGSEEPVIHSQGKATVTPLQKTPLLNLAELRTQCGQGTISGEQCYELYKAMGFDYGPGHRGVTMIHLGSNRLLAELSLPASINDSKERFVLHPSLMDSALQASVGLAVDSENKMAANGRPSFKTSVPFALREIEIFRNCTEKMWALIQYTPGNKPEDRVQKLDVDICDNQGRVCVRIKGFTSKVMEEKATTKQPETNIGTLLFEPTWKEKPAFDQTEGNLSAKIDQHWALLCESGTPLGNEIKGQMDGIQCLRLRSENKSIEAQFQDHTTQAFETIQKIFREKPKGKVLVQIVTSGQNERRLFSGLSGMLKTASQENPKLIGQLIMVDENIEKAVDPSRLLSILHENAHSLADQQIQYQQGKRLVADLKTLEVASQATKTPWRDDGVYLITGGAGGLGLIFANEIVEQTKKATLILTGRSALNAEKQAKLEALTSKGATIEYREIDVTLKDDISRLVEEIREQFGTLHGIIHSAGIIRDSFILKKESKELQQVLAPKVSGLTYLDRATGEFPLDFFVLFSSTAAVTGNPGQVDYASANAYMDAYAEYRNELTAKGERQGQTLSINWPLWKEGGMSVSKEVEAMMFQKSGMIAMKTTSGINAFYQALASNSSQVMVIEGDITMLRQRGLSEDDSAPTVNKKNHLPPHNPPQGESRDGSIEENQQTLSIEERVESMLIQSVSELLKIKIEEINVDYEFDEYGFDSITLTELANKLNGEQNLELPPTIFFEFPTISDLTSYLLEEHREILEKQFAPTKAVRKVENTEFSDSSRDLVSPSAYQQTLVSPQDLVSPETPVVSHSTPVASTENLKDAIQSLLIEAVSDLLKIKIEEINIDYEFDEYGFDSITLTELTNKLNHDHKLELAPTIFFEFPTISELTIHLLDEYRSILEEGLNKPTNEETTVKPMVEQPNVKMVSSQTESRFTTEIADEEPLPIPLKSRFIAEEARQSPSVVQSQTEESQSVEEENIVTSTEIAIIGMSGQFPMAKDVKQFWENIEEGKICTEEIPIKRWDWREFYGDPAAGPFKSKIKWGAFLHDLDEFDPLFFDFTKKEAENLDPQFRLLLSEIWHTIEDAGTTPTALSKGITGTFIAATSGEYSRAIALLTGDLTKVQNELVSMISNRIAYKLNLHGPCEYSETASSSALVALNRAVQSLQLRECEQAIVGAVNLTMTLSGFIGFELMGYLSEEGKSRSFQTGANGFVRSEGVGAVLLKPLEKAIKERDHIHAVIKGTAVSHGGKGISLTSPNPAGMKSAMVQAWRKAKIDPRTVSYIEAHGLASPMADAVEISSLKSGYSELVKSDEKQSNERVPCYISSLKPIIGHSELFSGIASLIKVVSAIRHKTIPGVPGFETLSEHISLQDSPFQITAENHDWKPIIDNDGNRLPRRAAINNYGFTGVNTHVVIEEYIHNQQDVDSSSMTAAQIVVLSAKNGERLQANTQQLLDFVECEEKLSLPNMAYTLQTGRESMTSRLAMVVKNREELIQSLKASLNYLSETEQLDHSINLPIPLFIKTSKEKISGKEISIDETTEENPEAVASHWVRGGKVKWKALHVDNDPRKISLPTYSFEKQRCWATEIIDKADASLPKTVKTVLDVGNTAVNNPEEATSTTSTEQAEISMDTTTPGASVPMEAASSVSTTPEITKPLKSKNNRNKNFPYLNRLKNPETPMIEELLTLDTGSQVELLRAGSGKPLVIIPGLDMAGTLFEQTCGHFAKEYEVIVYHYPGLGRSDMLADSNLFETTANQLEEVLKKLGINQPISLLGWSIGGKIAQQIAQQKPELCRSLTLVNPINRFGNLNGDHKSLLSRYEEDLRQTISKKTTRSLQTKEAELLGQLSQNFVENDQFTTGWQNSLRQLEQQQHNQKIEQQTLIITGAMDQITNDNEENQQPDQAFLNVNTMRMEQSGHFPFLTQPKTFNRTVSNFLRSCE